MRILFAFAGGAGHFHPLVPLARAAEAAGHQVAVSGRPSMAPSIEAAGFMALPAGSPPSPDGTGPSGGTGPAGDSRRTPLPPYDARHEERVLREHYAGTVARHRAELVRALCERWQPDVLVCDEVDFGSMIAAERLDLPYASVLVLAAGGFLRPEVVAGPLAELRAEQHLPADPRLRMLSRHLVFSPVPASYRDPAHPLPDTAYPVRPGEPGALPSGKPESAPSGTPTPVPGDIPGPWPGLRPDAPTVYCTLGTEFNVESGDLFERIIVGLRDLPINLLVTVGRQLDPAELGPQPGHVRVERYLPQEAVLPHCSASVSHAGSGSVLGALVHGLPMVLFPMGADQPANARRCAQLRLGQALDPVTAMPGDIRAATAAVLTDPDHRAAAELMRAEISRMPPPAEAVRRLAELVGATPSR